MRVWLCRMGDEGWEGTQLPAEAQQAKVEVQGISLFFPPNMAPHPTQQDWRDGLGVCGVGVADRTGLVASQG